jgi:hypothetical protein
LAPLAPAVPVTLARLTVHSEPHSTTITVEVDALGAAPRVQVIVLPADGT